MGGNPEGLVGDAVFFASLRMSLLNSFLGSSIVKESYAACSMACRGGSVSFVDLPKAGHWGGKESGELSSSSDAVDSGEDSTAVNKA